METYLTKQDGNPLKVNVECSSDAAMDGSVIFYIYEEGNNSNYKEINSESDGDNKFKGSINKNDLEERNILSIVSNYIVSAGQLPEKENIIKNTTVSYILNGGLPEKEFETNFSDNIEEFKGEANEHTFSVTKDIKINFIPRLKKDLEAMLLAHLNQ